MENPEYLTILSHLSGQALISLMLTLSCSTYSELPLPAKIREEYTQLCKGQYSMQTWRVILSVFVLRRSSFHLRWNVFSSCTHKYILCFEGLVRENENIRYTTNIFSSANEAGWKVEFRFSGRFAQGLPEGSCSRTEGIMMTGHYGWGRKVILIGGGRESVAIAKPTLALLPSTTHACTCTYSLHILT